MRRSLLFIPGNNPGMLLNCDVFESDAVIFDLEDAVSIFEKDSARMLVFNYLESMKIKTEIIIRINGMDTPYYSDDLEKIVCDKLDTIMLPKARVSDLQLLDSMLVKYEKNRNLTKKIAIIPIIESAISLLEVEQIVTYPRVNGVLLGAEDYTKDLEINRTKKAEEILYARNRIIVACKAYKIDAIDTPFTDVYDEDGLKKETSFVKGLGMNAKSAIHPNQIELINEIFNPAIEEINEAKRILASYEEAMKKGLGVFSLDGKMIDAPIIKRAQITIEKAQKFGVL